MTRTVELPVIASRDSNGKSRAQVFVAELGIMFVVIMQGEVSEAIEELKSEVERAFCAQIPIEFPSGIVAKA